MTKSDATTSAPVLRDAIEAPWNVSRAVHVADALPHDASALFSAAGAYMSLERLRQLELDRRWRSSYVVVSENERSLVVVPMYEATVSSFGDPSYNPCLVTHGLNDARRWALLGGRSDMQSSVLVHPQLSSAEASAAVRAAGTYARKLAHRRGRRVAVMYADELDEHACSLLEGSAKIPLVSAAAIEVPANSDEYLAGLKATHRSVVKRDWATRERIGVSVERLHWEDVLDDVAQWMAAASSRHGDPVDERVIRWRLDEWNELPGVERVAFAVQQSGQQQAAALAWRYRDQLQVYEVGVCPGIEHRPLVYVEAIIYAPLQYAREHACHTVVLGVHAIEPKRMRGARITQRVALIADVEV